jgi:SAM-dependent methyltransferase
MKHLAKRLIRLFSPKIPQTVLDDVYTFCKTAHVLRTPENCSKYFLGKYDVPTCKKAIACLYDSGMMGAYTFGYGVDPHQYMREYILNTLPDINAQSKIMEVGPGNCPLFNEAEYPNWYGCDVNYNEGHIDFSGKIWGKGLYKKIYNDSWDTLAAVCKEHSLSADFDLVCGCHSFEHTYKPVCALREAAQILRNNIRGGI